MTSNLTPRRFHQVHLSHRDVTSPIKTEWMATCADCPRWLFGFEHKRDATEFVIRHEQSGGWRG